MRTPVPKIGPDGHRTPKVLEILTALSMTVGRGARARAVAEVANIAAGDRVLDIGCGPGTAARLAARRGATVTGVDPSTLMLGLARLISSARRAHGLDWREGRAEALPVADRSVNVVWAISTFHHWDDPDAGIGEIHRVLAAGGILVLAERLVQPGAHGHAAHGLTTEQSEALASQLNAAGFTQVRWHNQHVGRRTIMVLKASQAGNPPGAR